MIRPTGTAKVFVPGQRRPAEPYDGDTLIFPRTDSLILPTVNPPSMAHPKTDDRGAGVTFEALAEHAAQVADDQQTTPEVDAAGELADFQAIASTQHLLAEQQKLNLALRTRNFLKNMPDGYDARVEAMGSILRDAGSMWAGNKLHDAVAALATCEGLSVDDRTTAIYTVVLSSDPKALCPDWCDDCFGPKNSRSPLHRTVVAVVSGTNPDGGTECRTEVVVERSDVDGVAGQAMVRVQQVAGSDGVVGGPGAVLRLARALLKARRLVKADRRQVAAGGAK